MEVNSSFGRIEKFNGSLDIIFLREFKATFSTMVCELEFKYGTNYLEVFTFKQPACYVHYEALDVYEQHSPRILGATQIPNLVYTTAITIAFHSSDILSIRFKHTHILCFFGLFKKYLKILDTKANFQAFVFL